MATIIEITDTAAPELAPYFRLTEAQLRTPVREDGGLFIAESVKVITVALEAGCRPVSFLAERKRVPVLERELLPRCGDVPVYVGGRELLSSLTGYALTRGVLCAMLRPAPSTPEEVCRDARRVAVLEGLTDTTNLGALFRSAAGLGMDAVLLSPRCADPLNRRSVRVSMGTVFLVPWARLGEDGGRWPETGMAALRSMGFRTAAMALRPDALDVTDPRLRREPRLAIFLGTEGDGLEEKTVAACDYTVRIPMAHGVDSLNVAAAGAVAFWALRAGI